MNDLYYELFYFCAKFYGHTNKKHPNHLYCICRSHGNSHIVYYKEIVQE